MASQTRPEPMNASPHHSKVKVTLTLSDPIYVAGGLISGKMQVENHAEADSSLGIGIMMVELYAIQEVNSGEHSATSTFIHSRRIFQGSGLPPSNAVDYDHVSGSGELLLPAHHYAARRGQTTFFFQFPLPASSPSSINFGPVCIRYEVQASVSVAWRGDKRLVTDKRDVKVVESWDPTNALSPQAVVITEGGKMWAQATLTNGVVVAGESARINLQLKNYTQRWTSGVTVTLTRDLHPSQSFLAGKSLPDTSDVATQVEFRGPEYSVPPGIEGVASLVIDIPRHSRGVKGGTRVDGNGKTTEGFFEVRCALNFRIDMPPGSEDTIVILPITIYHSLAVPETPSSPRHSVSSPYPCVAPVSPGLLSPPLEAALTPVYTGHQIQPYDPAWTSTSVQLDPSYSSNQQYLGKGTRNWQGVSYPHAPSIQRSISVGPALQPSRYTPELSASYTSSPRLLPPPPTNVSYTGYIHPVAPAEAIDSHTNLAYLSGVAALPSQSIHSAGHHHSLPPSPLRFTSSQPPIHDFPPTPGRTRPPPILIPPLPNPHDSQGILHSPRPVPSPKHSFHGSVPKSGNVSALERMADEVERQTHDLRLDLPKGDAGVDGQGPQGLRLDQQPNPNVGRTLPAPPVPCKDIRLLTQRPSVDTLFTTEGAMAESPSLPSQADQLPRAPPTPPIAAITPIKFPKAPMELSGLGANLGKESGLDALERKLLAEVGTRKFDKEERPHVRSIVQPIAIPPSGPPPDTANDSAISSLTLADREGFLNAKPEREQEQDRDSDERTQHMGGGYHSPSEDDRDVRTQKGKSSRKLGKSKHSEEDLERTGRRRERKKVKEEEGRKLKREAKGRVSAWLGEIDLSAPPPVDDPVLISPVASHFVPIAESASFEPSSPDIMTDDKTSKDDCRGNDEDISASPNPRSSGFVTISSLKAGATNGSVGDASASSFKPSPRRSSYNDLCQAPSPSPDRQMTARPLMSLSPSTQVKRTAPSSSSNAPPRTQPRSQPLQQQPVSTPSNRIKFPGRLPRFLSKPMDPEEKYDVRSARGGRGGRVTQVASLWAAKASANTGINTGAEANADASVNANANVNPHARAHAKVRDMAPKKLKLPMNTTAAAPPVVKKPVLNVLKRSPVSTRSPAITMTGPPGISTGGVGGNPNRVVSAPRPSLDFGLGVGAAAGVGLGAGDMPMLSTREPTKATKATTVPAVLSSSHAVPMLSSTASLARVKVPPHNLGHVAGPGTGHHGRSLPPMISENVTMSDVRGTPKSGAGVGVGVGVGVGGGQGRTLGDLAFGQARLRDLIKKYQG